MASRVSTLAVEWIEIVTNDGMPHGTDKVSTLAVEWIEIFDTVCHDTTSLSLHPRGGVD